MEWQAQAIQNERFVPAFPINTITIKHTLGKFMIAREQDPERSCGVAKRVGFTGKQENDLAIYRLKIMNVGKSLTTLPSFYVVTEGRFVEYEQWRQQVG